MNYDLACVLLTLTLVFFSIDYLTDNSITHDETKIGILIFIHHLACVVAGIGSTLCLLYKNVLPSVIVIIILSTIIQTGFLINNDYCWLTKMINKMIDPSRPNRKWRGDIFSLLKHYIRGDEWGYGDIRYINQTSFTRSMNFCLIIYLIKFIGKYRELQ
uniref:Uncharacterized protein n=1 Tax=viral metagenome TaxID=1070528 RepID=A0A6C0I9C3_9ZZZZ